MTVGSTERIASSNAWRALKSLRPSPFNAPALEWHGLRTAHAALQAVRAQQLAGLGTDDWNASRHALSSFLGPSDGHCFAVEPHSWIDLLEPQITKGLAHFLNTGGHRIRIRRVLALLQAVQPTSADPLDIAFDEIVDARAIAEAQCGRGRRIDVIAWVELSDGRRIGTVIEAKIGHHVTEGQLSSYEAAAAKPPYSLDMQATRFAVLAPSLTHATVKQLRRDPRWEFIAWRALLKRLGSALARSECDHDDFVRFRRTVWSCAA